MANKTFHVFRGKAGHVQCSFKWISCFLKHCLWNSFAFIVNSIRTPRLAALTLRVKPGLLLSGCFHQGHWDAPGVSPPKQPHHHHKPTAPPLLLSPTHNHKHNKLMLTEQRTGPLTRSSCQIFLAVSHADESDRERMRKDRDKWQDYLSRQDFVFFFLEQKLLWARRGKCRMIDWRRAWRMTVRRKTWEELPRSVTEVIKCAS